MRATWCRRGLFAPAGEGIEIRSQAVVRDQPRPMLRSAGPHGHGLDFVLGDQLIELAASDAEIRRHLFRAEPFGARGGLHDQDEASPT